MSAQFEWEFPALLPVASVVVALGGKEQAQDAGDGPSPVAIEVWGPKDGKSSITPRAAVTKEALSATKSGPMTLGKPNK